jgi:hypothetical protein
VGRPEHRARAGAGLPVSGHEHRRPERPADWPEAVNTPAQYEFDLLAALAEDPASGLEQVAPGIYLGRPVDHSGCPFCVNAIPHGWNSGPC